MYDLDLDRNDLGQIISDSREALSAFENMLDSVKPTFDLKATKKTIKEIDHAKQRLVAAKRILRTMRWESLDNVADRAMLVERAAEAIAKNPYSAFCLLRSWNTIERNMASL